jgi:hypothetical protein
MKIKLNQANQTCIHTCDDLGCRPHQRAQGGYSYKHTGQIFVYDLDSHDKYMIGSAEVRQGKLSSLPHIHEVKFLYDLPPGSSRLPSKTDPLSIFLFQG